MRTTLAMHALIVVSILMSPRLAPAQTTGLLENGTSADTIESRPASPVRKALGDSFRLLALEHTVRVAFQQKTRRELGGPFFADYARSLRVPAEWSDGDGWLINYVGHPIHGAAAGFIWLDHADDASAAPILSGRYWTSRARATVWAAAYSVQFEIGPLSEASIGNVGLRARTVGWVDHVMTPLGAMGVMAAEDAADRHLIARIESWTGNRTLRAIVRVALNPSRALSSGVQGRAPWFRPGRPLQ